MWWRFYFQVVAAAVQVAGSDGASNHGDGGAWTTISSFAAPLIAPDIPSPDRT